MLKYQNLYSVNFHQLKIYVKNYAFESVLLTLFKIKQGYGRRKDNVWINYSVSNCFMNDKSFYIVVIITTTNFTIKKQLNIISLHIYYLEQNKK